MSSILRSTEPKENTPLRVTAKRVIASCALPFVFFVSVLATWECIVVFTGIPKYLLPAPSAILRRLAEIGGMLLEHTLITLFESMMGFALASLLGIAIAISIAQSRVVERVIYPYVVVAKVVPIVAIAPLLMLWFGFGVAPKIVIAALISFFPIVVNTVKGLKSTDPQALRLMRSLSATPFQTFVKIRLPYALPYILAGFKIAIPLSVVGAVVGELVGADKGLGHLIMIAEAYLDTEMMFSAVIMAVILGVSLFLLVSVLERHLLSWHESVEATDA